MNTPTVALNIPSQIDGEPDEVEAVILDDLPPMLDQLAGYIDLATKQLANAERSRILADSIGMTADELREEYDESDRASTLARLNGAAKALCAAGAELRR